MKMARVILFTGQMDAMSKFYGEVLGLKKIVTNEKAGRSLQQAKHESRSTPAHRRRAVRAQRSYFTPRTLLLCGRRWWRGAQLLARSDKGRCFACAMARTQTVIPFNCPTAEN